MSSQSSTWCYGQLRRSGPGALFAHPKNPASSSPDPRMGQRGGHPATRPCHPSAVRVRPVGTRVDFVPGSSWFCDFINKIHLVKMTQQHKKTENLPTNQSCFSFSPPPLPPPDWLLAASSSAGTPPWHPAASGCIGGCHPCQVREHAMLSLIIRLVAVCHQDPTESSSIESLFPEQNKTKQFSLFSLLQLSADPSRSRIARLGGGPAIGVGKPASHPRSRGRGWRGEEEGQSPRRGRAGSHAAAPSF